MGRMCTLLEVSRSGFYAWDQREASPRAVESAQILEEIKTVHSESRSTYGSPRVHAELRRRGRRCGKKRVARLMAKGGLRSRVRRRFRPRTTDSKHSLPVHENLLAGDMKPTALDQIWVADITYVPTGEGWLYLASVLDLYSRKVVGWSMKATLRTELVLEALDMAFLARQPGKGLIHHSDRGSQYASGEYQKALKARGAVPSMSAKGYCYDNATKESFFHSLKTELVHDEEYETHEQAKASIFEWIEAFYNRTRIHSSLGYCSPAEFEAALTS